MLIKDSYKSEQFARTKFKELHGHVKLTLHNCRTGKNEVHEGDNIVTYAVRDIFANNMMGKINYNSLLPLWSTWYGGILCYQNAFAVDSETGKPYPNDYFPQGNNINPLTAHAGQTAPQDIADDVKRGAPNSAGLVFTENSVKQAWEWGSQQGNGIISALALTHKDVGDRGLGSTSNAFQGLSPFERIDETNLPSNSATYIPFDDNLGLSFLIGEDGDYAWGNRKFQTNKLTIYVKRMAYSKIGLFETYSTSANSQYLEKHTVELSFNLYMQPAYYFDSTNKELWIFSNMISTGNFSPSTINYAVIDCTDWTVDRSGTLVSDATGGDLAPVCFTTYFTEREGDNRNVFNPNIVKHGDYFIFPTLSGSVSNVTWGDNWHTFNCNIKGIRGIDPTSTADQFTADFNSAQRMFRSFMSIGGLLVCSGRVVNGGVGYTCADQFGVTQDYHSSPNYVFQQPNSPSSYLEGIPYSMTTSLRGIYACKLVHTTKYNLPESVQKTATQSMLVEYTLTETDPEE